MKRAMVLRRWGGRVRSSTARKTAALGKIVKFVFFAAVVVISRVVARVRYGEGGGSEDEEHSERAFESH